MRPVTTEPELDKLIIQNMEDLDATAKRIDALVREIWREVETHVETWAKARRWLTSMDWDDPWIAPPQWKQDDRWMASFKIGWGPGDAEETKEGIPYFHLSRLAGVGGGRFCLWLHFIEVKRSAWKPVFRDAASHLKAGGFLFDDAEGFYFDCTFSARSLAEAVAEDDYEVAFEPLNRALEAAHASWPLFDKMLKKARA